ncbi:MAG: YfhO family protein [Bacteroidales bacterium]|nr:YfhO family protein [Bacteroidales bacterium]
MKNNTNKSSKRPWWIHAIIIASFAVLSCIYFSPVLDGNVVVQGDIQKSEAMGYEQMQYTEHTGNDIPNWNSSMFSGMPGYQTAIEPQHSIFTPLKSILIGRPLGIERNIGVLFLYLLGFYIAMLAFGIDPWLALIGALAFALGSYNIIIIEAGHITKAWAISMVAPILGGLTLTLRASESDKPWRNILWGSILFTLALGLQITFNHIQITFYTAIAALVMGASYLIVNIKNKTLKPFFISVLFLLLGAGLAFGSNARNLLVNEEYAKYTMRGGSDISVTPDDLYHDGEKSNAQTSSTGLNIDYAYQWSYGIGETYTILVPGSFGGGSNEKVGENSESYRQLRTQYAPLYWGDQPFTSGPMYFGAIVVFLFILGFFVVKGPERWWLLIATVIAIIMSWGRNLPGINQWLFDNLPLYNKFRTPSMALVLANVCMAIIAVLALKEIFKNPDIKNRRAIYWSAGITGGFIIICLVFKGLFPFSGSADQQMAAQYGEQWPMLQDIFIKDRMSLFVSDSWRSILFILAAAVVLWLACNDKLKQKGWLIAILAALAVVDLWSVDRRYLNENNFTNPSRLKLTQDRYDIEIDAQAQANGDEDYRVINFAVNTFNDSKPSAFHHQIGGYSAAKLRRYQDIIDFYIFHHINWKVLGMLNTRYIVAQNGMVQRNPEALGNCWFVNEIQPVSNANEEILGLNTIDPATTAIVNTNEFDVNEQLKDNGVYDSSDAIVMEHQHPYSPDYLKYTSHTSSDRLAVFSEIYYAPDWRAYIDGKPAEYLRVNYILRAMIVPAGDHVIEFKNEAPRMHKLDNLTLVISLITLLLIAGGITFYYIAEKRKQAE